MRSRTKAMSLSFILMLSPMVAAHANGLSFDGLTAIENQASTREDARSAHVIDTMKLQANTAASKKLLGQLFDCYSEIYLLIDRVEDDCLKTWSMENFNELKRLCRQFNELLDQARRSLHTVDMELSTIAEKDVDFETLINLSEHIGRHCRNVTKFNTLLDFGWSKDICYDTLRPFDEETIEFAQSRGNYRSFYPEILFDETKERVFREVDRRDYIELYEERPLADLEETAQNVFDNELVSELVTEARRLIEDAKEIRERLAYQGNEKTSRNQRKIHFTCSLEEFNESYKTLILDYLRTVIELKGLRNEIVSYFLLSKDLFANKDMLLQWYEVEGELAKLCIWGSETSVICDPRGEKEREFSFFLCENYRSMYLLPKARNLQAYYIEKREAQLRRLQDMRSKDMITTAEALEVLRSTPAEERYQRAVELSKRIYDLSDENKAAIREVVDEGLNEYWNNEVTELPNHHQ